MIQREQILSLLEKDSRYTAADIAKMINAEEEAVVLEIAAMEADHIILGYTSQINWAKIEKDNVTALIQVSVTPQQNQGFNKIAEQIYGYPQVRDCYLLSGNFDLMIIVKDKTLSAVAQFISEKIACLDAVKATNTHFILKEYKISGTEFQQNDNDDREAVVL